MRAKDRKPVYQWMKSYHSLLDNPRYMRLSLEAKAIYHDAYLLAGKAGAAGLLCDDFEEYDADDIAYLLRVEPQTTLKALEELLSAGMMERDGQGWRISRFLDEQGAEGDDDEIKRKEWRERQSAHRERIKNGKPSEQDEEQTKPDEDNNRKDREERENSIDKNRVDKNRESRDIEKMSRDNETTNNPSSHPSLPEPEEKDDYDEWDDFQEEEPGLTDVEEYSQSHQETLFETIRHLTGFALSGENQAHILDMVNENPDKCTRILDWMENKKYKGALLTFTSEGNFIRFFDNQYSRWE